MFLMRMPHLNFFCLFCSLTSTVGLPLESRISRAFTPVIVESDDILKHESGVFPMILRWKLGVTKATVLTKGWWMLKRDK